MSTFHITKMSRYSDIWTNAFQPIPNFLSGSCQQSSCTFIISELVAQRKKSKLKKAPESVSEL